MSDSLRLHRFSGAAIHPWLPELARLRIQVFREFPYLYEGSAAYEEKYLKTYVDAPDSVMVVVCDGDRTVGASSGLPLEAETPNVIEPFLARGCDPSRIFYYGESVLLPEYRGRGLGKRFFEEREAHVRELGHFDVACFCAVERPADHPRRPAGYVPLDALWNRQGFVKHPELRATFSWRDLDEATESLKPMVFWLKTLR
ncbi:MAG: GNAT family N-acetyltransferase [Candidatus Contendobacter sp.]|nr:GNAT family N-acetyltransferase [Candidatus Contendobacter sp.]MDG4555831.1 GNAT family N-acetyltransferase [Candidatus Contendobacter sp.]